MTPDRRSDRQNADVGSRRAGYLLCVIAAPLFAMAGIVGAIAIDGGMAPLDFAAFRAYAGAVILLPFVLLALRSFRRRSLVPIILYAGIGVVASQSAYFEAISRIDIALALVIVFLAPLLVAAYERIHLGVRLPRYAYGAMLLAVGGVAVAVLATSGGIDDVSIAGLALAAFVMVTFAMQIILATRLPREVGPLASTGATIVVAAVLYIPLAPFWALPAGILDVPVSLDGVLAVDVPVWSALAWVALLGSALPFVVVIAGTQRIGAGAASMIGMIEPVIGSLIAWVLLGQVLEPVQVVGIGATIAGVAVVERARIRLRRPHPATLAADGVPVLDADHR